MQGAQVDQIIPLHSREAERAVLGAILKDSESIYLSEGLLENENFYIDAHRKIYSVIEELIGKGETADIVTVAEKLKQYKDDSQYLRPGYLVDLTENCPLTQNIEHYAKIVKRYYYLRKIVDACRSTIKEAMSWDGSIESYVESVEKEFLEITRQYDKKGIQGADKVLESTIEDIQKKLESDGTITGVPSGFSDLDAMTGGFQKSDLIIIAARPGMGKTALALNICTYAAFAEKSVVIFTLEMSKEQLMSRVLASVARVDSANLRRGNLSDKEQDQLMEGARQIFKCKNTMGIDETPGISLMELRSRSRRYQKEFGLDLIVIDYLQLMSASSSNRVESREREISQISMGLKELAKELKIPVIALAQLNRGPDARPDKRPKLSDLRESGSMEQDADLILFVYRDDYYNPSSELAGISEIIIGKNRHGSTSSIKLAFQANYVCFQNLYNESDD